MMDFLHTYKGDCHCGNIHLELYSNRPEQDFTPRTCQCSMCKQHGASWISDPEGEARVKFKNKDDVSYYRFGTKTSDFIICKSCGVLMIGTCELEGRLRAVINITAMNEEAFTAEEILTNFDGEDVEGRLGRRTQNWTSNVIIEE